MSGDLPPTDGRRKRSEISRDKIVAAMLELVAEGHVTPSAEQVASRASVGLRTVFRHFTDMDSLYAEMTRALARHYELWLVPYDSADWRGQLGETIDRRLATYERLLPFKRAADAHRHMSPSLQAENDRALALMRARLTSILPPAIVADAAVFEPIDLLLSFAVWQRLRGEQKLPRAEAEALVRGEVARIIDALPD